MKKLVSLALILVLCTAITVPAFAADYTEVIPLIYDDVDSFSEGLAAVKRDGKWGLVDKVGKEIVPCEYEGVCSISEGLAMVSQNGKLGFIDKTGKEVISCQYDRANNFSEGLAAVGRDGKYGFIDQAGREVIPCKYDDVKDFCEGLAQVRLDKKVGFIDKTGKEVVPCKYDLGTCDWFNESFVAVCIGDYQTGKWGFVDKMGNEAIPCKYDAVYPFYEGLAAVRIGDYETGKWGFVDATGSEVIPVQYDSAMLFSDGLAAVTQNGKFGYIDKKGSIVVPFKYDTIYEGFWFSGGLAYVFSEQGPGLIDTTGREVVECGKYAEVCFFLEDHPVAADYVFAEGLIQVIGWDDWKRGFIDATGKEVIPCKYDDAGYFSGGLAIIKTDIGNKEEEKLPVYKYGYIDKVGKEVVPCKYDDAKDFSEGLAAVALNGKWGFISLGQTATSDFTVTFNLNYTDATDDSEKQTVTRGGTVTKPADPTRSGYTFDGWYKEQTCTNAWDFNTKVTANTTLYAKWTEETPPAVTEYTVTFDSQGGSAVSSQTVTSGGKVTKPADPTRSGYTFDGWYKEQTCTNAWDFNTKVTANTTLYAKWTEETPPAVTEYTVTFDSQGGSAVASQTVTGGGKVTRPADPTRDGYTFGGWYKEAACTNKWDFDTAVTANTTLYAKWTEDSGTTTPTETYHRIYTDYYTSGGSVYMSHSSAVEGARITIEVSPRSGYELDWLSVYNLNTGRELTLTQRYYDTYTFSMPNGPVGVEVSFFREDIDSGSWYVPEIIPVKNKTASSKTVRWYYNSGQIGHVTDGTVPYGTLLTRDMLISILYNMDPNSTGEPLFWATQQKVMPDIYPSGLWGTDKNISREQAAMILYNYSRHMGYNLSPSLDLSGCADYAEMRPIARTAMSWAQATGLFSRNLLNTLSPKSTLTCGEANTLLSRFVSTVARTR